MASGTIVNEAAVMDKIEAELKEGEFSQLSISAIEEGLEYDQDSSRDGKWKEVKYNGDDSSNPQFDHGDGNSCVQIPLGHDRSTKTRSLDVQATGDQANISFDNLFLKPEIIEGLKNSRFYEPSPIQISAIPSGKYGFDLILQSKSGTGKTCVFGVIVLEQLDQAKMDSIQAVILTPTRELAVQVKEVMDTIGCFLPGLRVKCFIGGTSVEQSKARCKKCNVVVGTPGRILHMITDGYMDVSGVTTVVLDEADRMIGSSFLEDVTPIFNAFPKEKQVIAASATYPEGLKSFVKHFMRDPLEIATDASPILLAVDHYVADVNKILDQPLSTKEEENFTRKVQVIVNILKQLKFTQVILFSRYVLKAEKIYNSLKDINWNVSLITSAMDQCNRLKAFNGMKDGLCQILVASDVVARGIDYEGVDVVINFELPDDICTYVHRAGRAGRFGSSGLVVTLLSFPSEYPQLAKMLSEFKTEPSILESPKHIEDLAQSGVKKLRKVRCNFGKVLTQEPEYEHWHKMLDIIMQDPCPVSDLDLDVCMGLQLNVDMNAVFNKMKEVKDACKK